jgi:2-methylcitrate dehydratase PrpD
MHGCDPECPDRLVWAIRLAGILDSWIRSGGNGVERLDNRADHRLAAFVAETRWGNLPPAVRNKVRLCLLDILGAAIVGTRTRISEIAARFADARWPGEESTILMHGKRALAEGAAFANACAANGIDIDDNAKYTKGHPGSQVFSTSLALAERLEHGGGRMLCAMVIGYEVAHRAARCWHDHYERLHADGSWGAMACAAAACNLMDLTTAQIIHALGIADYYAPNAPLMRDVVHPAMVKHAHGWAAMTGIISADLAGRGFTSVPSILSFDQYHEWVEDIGRQYLMVDGVTWKRYACCAWSHPAIKGAKQLMQDHGLQLADVAHILIEAPYEATMLGTELPSTTEEAQFNMAWPVAAMLVCGQVGPDQVTEASLGDEHIREMAKRVEVVESEKLSERYSDLQGDDSTGRYGSVVTFTLRDGTQLTSHIVEEDYTYPQLGWDQARVEDKFRWLANSVIDTERVEKLIAIVRQFEKLQNLGDFTSLLA